MLTRLKVDGFKNLIGVDLRFGAFTCVAGPNGVGKSNLFDAIAFLAALADKPLMEAAMAVRGGDSRRGDVQSLFHRVGSKSAERMSLMAEMVIPFSGEDPLGQPAEASMTYLRYTIELGYRADPAHRAMGTLEVLSENMVHINRSEAKRGLGFKHSKAWRDSVILGRRTSPYISTDVENQVAIVALHADSVGGLGGGRPRRVPAAGLPRTMLSSVNNATENRTLVLARREMASWTQLQLEPSSLRAPDSFTAPRSISPNGAHVAATLFELAQAADRSADKKAIDVYAGIANRLSQLVESVREVSVDVDQRRQLLNIVMSDHDGTEYSASALSDGTLRFLALVVMEADPKSRSLVCLEEPENGMHPLRIPAVIALLGDLAVDVDEPVDADNPLRQVIINTHSPSVVACIDDSALLVAQARRVRHRDLEETSLTLRHLAGTWRDAEGAETVTRGDLLAYLNPLGSVDASASGEVGGRHRVIDRADVQILLPGVLP